MSNAAQVPTDNQELLDRVEQAYAERTAAQRAEAEAEAAAAAARAEAEAAEQARRQEAARTIECALADARKAAAALVKSAREWHRNVEALKQARDAIIKTLRPYATGRQREGIAMLADMAARHELQATIDGPTVTRMDRDLAELVELRAARIAERALELLQQPAPEPAEEGLV
jgi:hypothetical protein